MFNRKTQNTIMLLGLIVVLISQIVQFGSAPSVPTAMPIPTATPWVKQNILIETKSGKGLDVWTDNIATDRRKIDEIEGVISTILLYNDHMIYVSIDPRYDNDLVAKVIADRLINSRTN